MRHEKIVAAAQCIAKVTRAEITRGARGGRIILRADKTRDACVFVSGENAIRLWEYMTPTHLRSHLTFDESQARQLCKWLIGRTVKIRWVLREWEEESNLFAQYDGYFMELVR
jgi:hypothetical protein